MPSRQPDAKIESESFFLNSKMSSESEISIKKTLQSTTEIENCSFKKSRLSQDISETYFLVGDVQ